MEHDNIHEQEEIQDEDFEEIAEAVEERVRTGVQGGAAKCWEA